MQSVAAPQSTPDHADVRVGILDPKGLAPTSLRSLLATTDWHWFVHLDDLPEAGDHAAPACDVLVIVDGWGEINSARAAIALLSRKVAGAPVSLVILTDNPLLFSSLGSAHVCLPPNCDGRLILGAILGMQASYAMVRRADGDRTRLRQVTESIHKHVDLMDAELRLASRLQRDFLPSERMTVGAIQFATLYRPCAWVSGDIFDIMRLDEDHVGFYLADVAGHGVAAGLLTMYVKHAITPKRVLANGYQLIAPAEVLRDLNEKLVGEALRDSLFVTGWYGLLNIRTLRLDYATAGHPPPMFVRDGAVRELHSEGGLLGLMEGQEFTGGTVQLARGDRVVLYSDGLEGVLISHRPPLPQTPTWEPGIEPLMSEPRDALLAGLEQRLDCAPGSLNKSDDASVVVMDVAAE